MEAEATKRDRIADAIQSFADASTDPKRLVEQVAQTIATLCNGGCGVTIVTAGMAHALAVACPAGTPAGIAARIRILTGVEPVAIDDPGSPFRLLLESGKAMTFKVTPEAIRARFKENQAELEIANSLDAREAMLVPMIARGTCTGWFNVVRFGAEAQPFTVTDMQLAQQLADHAALAMLDARLLIELGHELAERRKVETRQQSLMDLARELAALTGDHGALIARIAQRFGQLADAGCVIRFRRGGRFEAGGTVWHRDPAIVEAANELFVSQSLDGEGVAGQVARQAKPIRIYDETPEMLADRFNEPVRTWCTRLGIYASLGVPLISDGQMIAVITLFRTKKKQFTHDDQQLIMSAASYATLALMNATLFADMQRELTERTRMQERSRLLTQVARELAAATGDLPQLLVLAAEWFGKHIGDSCFIRLVEDNRLSTGMVWNADPQLAEDCRVALLNQPQLSGEGMAGRAWQTGEPLLVNATPEILASKTQSAFGDLMLRERIHALLSVPLHSRGGVIGVITLARNKHFADEEVALAIELGTHTALAIDNSRLLEETRKQLERVEKTEAQFRQAQKMEAVGRLAGGIAHDFNNLLTVIVNASSVLLEDVQDPTSRSDIEDIQGAAERAADLTRQLLAFSRQQVLEPQLLDLNAIVQKTQKMIARVVGEDIAVKVELDADLARTKADPGHINQVLMNLVVNARDAMPNGGTLTITTLVVEGDVMLAISDTGIGMDEATQHRIFEPFFTTKDKSKGTGLGLSTVIGIVEQSGGRMQVESALGHGATFRVFLPRCDEAPPERESGEHLPLRGGETILLVEDESQVRKVATAILHRSGYRVLAAQNGADAIAQYADRLNEVDLLLTDVVMPGMSGRELSDRLTAIRADLRVVYMSGYTDDAISHHRVLDPGVQLVPKPFTKASLLDRVRYVLTSSPYRSSPRDPSHHLSGA
ncbi:MAG: GAF domain-containing protein [Kofleriaceae bacterium]